LPISKSPIIKRSSEPSPVVSEQARAMARLGLTGPKELALHLPMRYIDMTRVTPIDQLQPDDEALVEGEVIRCDVVPRPRRSLVVEINDDSGVLQARFFHFYPSALKQFAVGRRVRLFGAVKGAAWGARANATMFHPVVRPVSDASAPTPTDITLTPIYSSTAGLSQTQLRKAIAKGLREAQFPAIWPADWLPRADTLGQSVGAWDLLDALKFLHNPPAGTDEMALHERSHPAWQRVILDELIAQQVSLAQARARRASFHALRFDDLRLARGLLEQVGFSLTPAQHRVCAEIQRDLASGMPMNRLLQGDVGSGKTVVAALACLMAIAHGAQVAFMAPTEILAEQHYRKLSAWLAPLGVRVGWLTGSLKAKDKLVVKEGIARGQVQLAIGTHALIEDDVQFTKLGLVVTDEQHRFGVKQRLALRREASIHHLMMSATPIPRTLAMTYYADLDVSTIDELPPGRTPVVTKLIDEARRDQVLERVRAAIADGRQVYWVCPLIEESEALQLQTAQETFDNLRVVLPDIPIGLVHGRLPTAQKNEQMQAFVQNQAKLLVATTVIEVGVDVPNASLMVIEHAERFGLAQLHQLRGRVGRGAALSACVLLYRSPLSLTARERLRIMFETTDGFEIAQRDLQLRGPGEFLGARQSGAAMLRFADLERDSPLIALARQLAERLLAPGAENETMAQAQVARWLSLREDFLKA
jgi:ATP-dependent DNA helicase RecG